MGLLVGNTTVIEHAGTYVEYSRTYSHVKYSPEKVSIGFVLPKGMKLSDGYALAEAIVNARLGLNIDKSVNGLCIQVFDEPIAAFYRRPRTDTEPRRYSRARVQSMIEEAYDG